MKYIYIYIYFFIFIFFKCTHGKQHDVGKGIWIKQWTTKLNTQMGPGRESEDFSLRIDSSIGELLLLLYKSGFYRRE